MRRTMRRLSRREFARSAAAALAATALLKPAAATADDAAKATPPAPPTAHKFSAAAQTEVEARVQLIVARYGARLSAAERADLLRMSGDLQESLEKIRAYPLDPSDQPAPTFRAPRRRR
jgi:hypothetical protein